MHMPSVQVSWLPDKKTFESPPEGYIGTRRVHFSHVIPVLEDAYQGFCWSTFEKKMYQMIYEVFLAFAARHPDVEAHSLSRAMYAVDVMIRSDGSPAILEVQFTPNFEHQARFEEGFINSLFSLLFLRENTGEWVQAGPSK